MEEFNNKSVENYRFSSKKKSNKCNCRETLLVVEDN